MHYYKSIYSIAQYLVRIGCATSEKNQNLTYLEKLLLQWNFKLGHTVLSKVQCIGSPGCLGKLVEKMRSNNVNILKCTACQYGRQEINPKSGTNQSKDK